jgi:DNA mismatch repair protein MLH1
MSTLDVLRQVYGAALARELLPVSFETPKLSYSLKGFVSNANYNTKKSVFLLFINRE